MTGRAGTLPCDDVIAGVDPPAEQPAGGAAVEAVELEQEDEAGETGEQGKREGQVPGKKDLTERGGPRDQPEQREERVAQQSLEVLRKEEGRTRPGESRGVEFGIVDPWFRVRVHGDEPPQEHISSVESDASSPIVIGGDQFDQDCRANGGRRQSLLYKSSAVIEK